MSEHGFMGFVVGFVFASTIWAMADRARTHNFDAMNVIAKACLEHLPKAEGK